MKASVSRLTLRPTASALSGFCLNRRPTLLVGSRTAGRRRVDGPTGVTRQGSASTTAAPAGRRWACCSARTRAHSAATKWPPARTASSKASKAKPKSESCSSPCFCRKARTLASWTRDISPSPEPPGSPPECSMASVA